MSTLPGHDFNFSQRLSLSQGWIKRENDKTTRGQVITGLVNRGRGWGCPVTLYKGGKMAGMLRDKQSPGRCYGHVISVKLGRRKEQRQWLSEAEAELIEETNEPE